MTEEIISDAVLTEELQKVFGIGNVESANRNTGAHTVFLTDRKKAHEVIRILSELGLEDCIGQSSGSFGDTYRPNVIIIAGNESQRSEDPELKQNAIKLIEILNANKEALQK